MKGPVASKVDALRERVGDLGAVHASLSPEHRGWANCECSLAARLRELSDKILKLVARKAKR